MKLANVFQYFAGSWRILTGVVLAILTGLSGLHAQSSEFKTGGAWNTAGNWNPSGVPGSGNNVVIDSGSPTGGAYTMSSSLIVEDLSFSLTTNTTLKNSGSGALTLTLNGGRGSSMPLIALNSANNLTMTNGASGSLGLVLAASGAIDSASSGKLTIGSNIAETGGAQALTFSNTSGTGTSTITLSGANSFTGGLVISGNSIEVDVTSDGNLGGAGGSVTINGGRLGIATNNTTIDPTRSIFLGANPSGGNNTGTLSIKGAITVSYSGSMRNFSGSTGDLVKQGGGTLVLGGTSSYSGNTFLNNGITQLLVANALPTTTTVNLGQSASANLGTLDLNGHSQQVAGLNSVAGTSASTSTNVVTSATAATLTIGGSGNYIYSDGSAANSGVVSGAISVVMNGAGTQTFGGANAYTGGTTVSGGTLALGSSGTLGATAGALAVSGGTLDLGHTTQTVGAVTLSGGIIQSTGGTGTLSGSSYTVQNGTINAVFAGSGALTKSGSSTVTLSGVNTYTGTTTINAGTLAVNGSLAAGSALTANSGGTLSGTGTVFGSVSAASGGAISPGSASPGILTIGGNLTLNNGSVLNFRLASAASDKLTLSGSGITLTGNTTGAITVNLLDFNGSATVGTYDLVSVTGTSITPTNWGLSAFTLGSMPANWSGSLQMSGNDLEVVVTTIPEPSAYAAIFGLLTLTGAAWIRRRRMTARAAVAASEIFPT